MSHEVPETALCDLFGIRWPIVQTGMSWVATPELTAATSNAGGLGVLASAVLSVDELARAIERTSELTNRPFGVNMRGDAADLPERSQLLVKYGVKVASFALVPSERTIKDLKDKGLRVVPTIGARRHAEKVAAWGVDAVIAQGFEAGGHTGTVPTSILLPQVVDAVDIPVIAAGGFSDGRGLVAALAFGAVGIAMGTRFLLTAESPVPDNVKREYLSRGVNDTVVTPLLDGVPQRVLRTPVVDALTSASVLSRTLRSTRAGFAFKKMSGEKWSHLAKEGLAMKRAREVSWPQAIMAANTPMMQKASMVDGRVDVGTLASGQITGLIDDLPTCQELIDRIVSEAGEVLSRLGC